MTSGTGSDPPPPVKGFLKTTWQQRAYLPGWDLAGALLLTAASVVLVDRAVLRSVLPDLLMAEFGLIGAILGVVIAGLAIVVAFLSRDYANVLARAEGGSIGDFWPFWFVASLSAAAVIAAGAGIVVVRQVCGSERVVFGVTTFLSTYAVLATVSLVAFVAQQGVTRVWQLTHQESRDSA